MEPLRPTQDISDIPEAGHENTDMYAEFQRKYLPVKGPKARWGTRHKVRCPRITEDDMCAGLGQISLDDFTKQRDAVWKRIARDGVPKIPSRGRVRQEPVDSVLQPLQLEFPRTFGNPRIPDWFKHLVITALTQSAKRSARRKRNDDFRSSKIVPRLMTVRSTLNKRVLLIHIIEILNRTTNEDYTGRLKDLSWAHLQHILKNHASFDPAWHKLWHEEAGQKKQLILSDATSAERAQRVQCSNYSDRYRRARYVRQQDET
jgi:hypothetical protein